MPGTCERCVKYIKKAQERIDILDKALDIKITWEGGGNSYNAWEGFPFEQIKALIRKDAEGYLDCTCSTCIDDQAKEVEKST